MDKLQPDPYCLAQRSSPTGKILRRLPVDGFVWDERAPPSRLGGPRNDLGKSAVGREAAVTEAEHGDRNGWLYRQGLQAIEKPPRRSGRIAIAIGCRKNENAPGMPVAFRIE